MIRYKTFFNSLFFLLIAFVGCSIFFGCKKPLHLVNEVTCDFETIDSTGKWFFTSNSNFNTKTGGCQISPRARSGKYAALQLPLDRKGIQFEIPGVYSDEILEVTLWRKDTGGKSILAVAESMNDKLFFIKETKVSETDSAGWEKLVLRFTVPPQLKDHNLVVYTINPGNDTVLFDDLSIINHSFQTYPKYPHDQTFYIYIDTLGMQKLLNKRKDLYTSKMNLSDESDWVQSVVFAEGLAVNARVRLRGQSTDHVKGGKWSLRIDMGNQSWKGMSEFSIYNPELRNYSQEMFVHKWFLREGLLATQTGFVPVSINGKSIGVMLYEQDFEPEFPELNHRPEGLIFRFNDQAQILSRSGLKKMKINSDSLPFFFASDILVMSEKKLNRNPFFPTWYQTVQNIVYQFKYQLQPPDQFFDMDILARFCAITDLSGSWHTLKWQNLRLYFNPYTETLEPIAHDCRPEIFTIDNKEKLLVEIIKTNPSYFGYPMSFFTNAVFYEKYNDYLKRFSNPLYIDSLKNEFASNLELANQLLKKEFKGTDLSFENYYVANKIMNATIGKTELFPSKDVPFLKKISFDDGEAGIDQIPEYLVKAYTETETEKGKYIFIRNYLPFSFQVTGSGSNSIMQTTNLRRTMIVPAEGSMIIYDIPKGDNYLFCRRSESNTIFTLPVQTWASPKNFTSLHYLNQDFLIGSQKIEGVFSKNGETHFKGNIELSKPLIIPAREKVIFEAGSTINLIQGAFILSYSSIEIQGNENFKVRFVSTDGKGKGIAVLQAMGLSKITNAVFDGLFSPSYSSWLIPGMLSFYRSSVQISKTEFINTKTFNGLYVSGSQIQCNRLLFKDHSTNAMTIENSNLKAGYLIFNQTTRDAVSISGSAGEIDTCSVNLSGGMAFCVSDSKIALDHLILDQNQVGIVAYNSALVSIGYGAIKNSEIGLSCFDPSPLYGESLIMSRDLQLKGIHKKFQVSGNSKINYNGVMIQNTERKLVKR